MWCTSPHTQRGAVTTRANVDSGEGDRKSTRLNSSHLVISYAVFCLKKKNNDDLNDDHQVLVNQYTMKAEGEIRLDINVILDFTVSKHNTQTLVNSVSVNSFNHLTRS